MGIPVGNLAPAARSLSQSGAVPGEPTEYSRAVNLGLVATGVVLGAVAYPHRQAGWGYILGNVGAGLAAIGTAFLFLDIVGARTPEGPLL